MTPAAVGNIFIALSAIPAFIFTCLYFRVNWWKSKEGAMLWCLSFVDGLVLLLAIIRIWWDPPWTEWFRLGVFTAFPAVRWWMLVILIMYLQQRGEDREANMMGAPENATEDGGEALCCERCGAPLSGNSSA